jgi:phospholipase D1/2
MSTGKLDAPGIRGGDLAGLAVLVVVLVALWRLTPLHTLLDTQRLAALGAALRENPAAPGLVLLIYLAGALLLFPMTLMMAATALVFDPLHGLAYGLAGALAAAVLTFAIGRMVGRFRAGWLARPRFAPLRARLQRRGVLTMATVRWIPGGNFSLINIVAGAIGIRFRDYMLGTLIGILPGLLALTLLADRLHRAGWGSR